MTLATPSSASPTVASPRQLKPKFDQHGQSLPFYQTVTLSWKDVRIEGGIPTDDFCLAADAVVDFFDLFNNPAFNVVQSDLRSKLKKIRGQLALYPTEADTIERMLEHEKDEKVQEGTGSLVWLVRTLNLILLGLRQNLAHPGEEISTSLTNAYEKTLKPHHPYLVRPIFYMAMKACPSRENFYPRLGSPQDVVIDELVAWLDGLDRVTKRCGKIFNDGGYGKRY